jgi:16S rRNA (guanine527-N7)-methyltransferase
MVGLNDNYGAVYGLLKSQLNVSRETQADFEAFVAQLKLWQKSKNLVSASTLNDIWSRHIADSLQLLTHKTPKSDQIWLDMGAGAGLPGLILAIYAKQLKLENWQMIVVEANYKKCAFMREAIRQLQLPAKVLNARLENLDTQQIKVDVITARALASLPQLMQLARPLLKADGQMLLQKGKTFDQELKDARESWDFTVETHKSVTEDDAAILILSGISLR